MNTKKLLLHAAVLATMLTSISCSQEEVAGGQAGDESVVTFTAQLPGSPQSKAIGDGMTATTLSYAVYAQGTKTPLITSEDEVTFTNGQATISLRLASGKSYDFLFWADAYDSEDVNAPYTVNFKTQTLTIDYDAAKTLSNDERRDAFFGTTTLEVKGAVNGNVTLKRPFAQLNIGTNDMEDAANTGLNTSALRTSVKVKNVSKNLNLMNGEVGEVGEDDTVTFEEYDIPKGQFTANGNTYAYLALNYLLVGSDKGVVDCEFTYTDGPTKVSKTISNVPVQRNYRTNIFGSILTGAVDLGITIDPAFEEPDYNYDMYAELLNAAQYGGSVTLREDVTITDEAPIIIDNGITLTVDLNGNTITRTGADNEDRGVWAFRVNNGTLILKDATGTGTIDGGAGLEHSMLWANGSDAKIIINSGNYTVGGNPTGNNYNVCVYASNGGQVEIYGGTFENKEPQTGSANLYPALNVSNGSPGTITVYGGTFKNYDPATGDDATNDDTFVASGYSSVKVSATPTPNGTYEVVRGTGAATSTDLAKAIESGAELITLASDVTIDNASVLSSTNHNSAIDLNGKTLTIKGKDNLHVSEGGDLTFSNGNIVANEITDPTFTLFVANANSSVTFDGVQLTTTGTGISPANSASNASITIKNSELHCEAYAVATNATTPVGENVKITLENSKFYGNSTVFFNIPCEATINNCEIYGDNHGMVLRGGKATVSNSTITLEYTDDDYEEVSKFFDNRDWGTGNWVNIAALTVGNKSNGYQYPSELHLVNTKVISTGTHATYFPALYSWANQGEDLGVTITYDDQTTFTGDVIYGSANITVNGEPEP